MNLSRRLAKHIHNLYFGGNWADVNLRELLADISLSEAQLKENGLHSIHELVFHIHYFVHAQLQVLKGSELSAHDSLSFHAPIIKNEEAWQDYKNYIFSEAKQFANEVEKLPDAILETFFVDKKYGDYFSNLQGVIEHSHYHLGQLALLKKMIRSQP